MLTKTYNPKKTEKKIYRFWEKSGFFNPDKLPGKRKKPYSILLPPPNITGELHMGHTLNALIQDALVRKKRMEGFRVLWLPGIDHAGIATQNVVEKQLKKEGLSRFDLGRAAFLKKVWQWKKKYGNIIPCQLKQIGASCDWSRQAFTMDKGYAEAVRHAFVHYWNKGLIYRGERPINWCPRCKTSLSDLELEYEEKNSKLWYIRYPLIENKKKYVVVATTRPETMLGDTAVAVNPKDRRYKGLLGKKVLVPIINREISIVADQIVDPNFGTGAVKVTPAHDLKDYEVGLRHNLPILSIIDENGKMNSNCPKEYQELKTEEAREKIVSRLKNEGLLAKEELYLLKAPKCSRCGRRIEIIPSQQWFLKMERLAQKAKKAVSSGRVRIYPKSFEKTYFNWLNNIRDWCVSRQLWWGHRLPIWQCQNKKKNDKKQEKEYYFASLRKPKKCPVCGKCRPKQIEDVLDTWFSSALWPFAPFNWPTDCIKDNKKYCLPKKGSDLASFYPSGVLTTARDIINLWVARMIFSGLEFMGKAPFPKIFIHPTILNKKGQRMSKSLGTGVNPIELVEKYGADAVRFGLAWQLTGLQDIRFDEQSIIAGKKFCNKIWNAARFVLLQIGKSKLHPLKNKRVLEAKIQTKADKKIIAELDKTIKSVEKNLENFHFSQAVQCLYHFFWHQFCDIYLEASKKQLNKDILLFTLLQSLKLLHPFMPFITEEIYQKLPVSDKKQTLMIESWPNMFIEKHKAKS